MGLEHDTALYIRVSKDDEGMEESSSINTQKKMLSSFARENGFLNFEYYIDEGYSGTNFDRPAFERLMYEIEEKRIKAVIVKDLSRFGRDYILTGNYTENYLPKMGVRFIAINDCYDSKNIYNDIAPFKNVINEMYARDTSKKIRSSLKTKMKEGCFIGNFAPYGYQKSHLNKNKLEIDEDSALIVREIFTMANEGYSSRAIADFLNKKKVVPPAVYRCMNNPKLNIDNYTNRKEWTASTIKKMLGNIVYIGHLAQGKTSKSSFRNSNNTRLNKNEWIIVEDSHAPIVDKGMFDDIQDKKRQRRDSTEKRFENLFSGIAKCADCGRNMSTAGKVESKMGMRLACGGYKLYGKNECSNHYIYYNDLSKILLDDMEKKVSSLIDKIRKMDVAENIEKRLINKYRINNYNETHKYRELEKRINDIETIIKALYKDKVLGKVDELRFNKLLGVYEQEERLLLQDLELLKNKSDTINKESLNLEVFKALDELISLKKINSEMIYTFVERIEIHQGEYVLENNNKIKHQKIDIIYRF